MTGLVLLLPTVTATIIICIPKVTKLEVKRLLLLLLLLELRLVLLLLCKLALLLLLLLLQQQLLVELQNCCCLLLLLAQGWLPKLRQCVRLIAVRQAQLQHRELALVLLGQQQRGHQGSKLDLLLLLLLLLLLRLQLHRQTSYLLLHGQLRQWGRHQLLLLRSWHAHPYCQASQGIPTGKPQVLLHLLGCWSTERGRSRSELSQGCRLLQA